MTDHAALLAAICTHPAEDTPRLMFADFLEEHGEPEHAEFVRVQVEAAHAKHKRLPPHEDGSGGDRQCWHDCPLHRLESRAQELWVEHGADFAAGLPMADILPATLHVTPFLLACGPNSHSRTVRYTFRRGLVETVECSAETWLRIHAGLYWRAGQGRACPGTASPVAGVRLTSDPVVSGPTRHDHTTLRITAWVGGADVAIDEREAMLHRESYYAWTHGSGTVPGPLGKLLYERRWPGVTFEVPPTPRETARL